MSLEGVIISPWLLFRWPTISRWRRIWPSHSFVEASIWFYRTNLQSLLELCAKYWAQFDWDYCLRRVFIKWQAHTNSNQASTCPTWYHRVAPDTPQARDSTVSQDLYWPFVQSCLALSKYQSLLYSDASPLSRIYFEASSLYAVSFWSAYVTSLDTFESTTSKFINLKNFHFLFMTKYVFVDHPPDSSP